MIRLYNIFISLICLLSVASAQVPTGLPTPYTAYWYNYNQYVGSSTGYLFNQSNDTNFVPSRMMLRAWQHAGSDTSLWFWTGSTWQPVNKATNVTGFLQKSDSSLYATVTRLRDTAGALRVLINTKLNLADSGTKYLTPTQGNANYYPRSSNPASYLTGNQTITLSNDATGSGTTSIAVNVNKLAGQLPSYYLNRANQTGTQNISTVNGLSDTITSLRTAYNTASFDSTTSLLTLGSIDGSTTSLQLNSGGSGGDSTIAAGPISSLPTIGFNPGTNINSAKWIVNTFYQSQAPTASISGGTTLEITTAGTQSKTVNWTANRLLATALLDSIVITGPSSQRYTQSFSQPSAPGSVSGSQVVTLTNNTTNTFTVTVYAHNGQTASASTSWTFQSKYYIGYVSSNAPTDVDLLSATGGTVGGVFATQRQTSGSLSTPGSSSFIVFAYPASFGTTPSNSITIGGFATTYNLIVRNVVNASGATVSYNVYVSPFPTNSGISYQVQ
jgi:hypothetical protein